MNGTCSTTRMLSPARSPGVSVREIRADIENRGGASIALSGGTTPARFLTALGACETDWAGVSVTLVDERFVDEASPRSNARLVRETLLEEAASAATFIPLCADATDLDAAAAMAAARIATIARPFAAVVLGMGADGHTASWFADGDRLAQALDPAARRDVIAMRAPSAGEARITLTLPAVLDTRFLALHIEGENKRRAVEKALEPDPPAQMPVRAVLRQDAVRVEIFWCPLDVPAITQVKRT